MIKYPLFGKDSIPHKTSSFLGIVITAIVTLIFFIVTLFIKFPEKQKFEVIKITLETTPAKNTPIQERKTEHKENTVLEKSTQEKALAPEKNEQQVVSKPKEEIVNKTSKPEVVKKQTETIQPVKQEKAESKKNTTVKEYAKAPEYELVKSVDDLLEEQINTKKASVDDFDWDFFEDSSASSEYEKTNVVATKSTMEGSAAQVLDVSNTSQKSTSTSMSKDTTVASSGTKTALSEIKSVSVVGNETKTDLAFVKVSSENQNSVKIEMEDGSTRTLLKPESPNIVISDESARLIEGNRTVQIKFRVIENGNVPLSEISITPLSVLPQKVRSEIEEQLSNWIFEPASYDSIAVFEYSIIKK